MRKTVSGIMLTLLLISMLMLTFNIQPVKAGTITVPDDYPTIQEAINHANEGDTIYVKAGTYYENVVVDKSVSLIGQNRINTIIDGWHSWIVVSITASNVTIANFTITNSICGIFLWENCSYSNIFENKITNNQDAAVALWYSSSNYIFGNTITTNGRGINLTCSSNNNIFQNSIQNDIQHGICVGCCSDYNNIYENNITDNDFGIQLYNSLNNCIYHNNFINNLEQTIVNYANVWDDGYPSGGNFWSDYNGTDDYSGPNQDELGNDGIGDTSYIIDENNRDRYPLMVPWGTQYPHYNWPMFHRDISHTGYSNSKAPNTNDTIWNYTTGYGGYSSPTVADGQVYIGSGNKVYCLDATTGTLTWNYTTGRDVMSSPAVVDGKVYIGSMDREVYCLNASNGSKIWNYTTGSGVDSSPAVAENRVYVGSYDGRVYCLDALTGTQIWNYTTGSVVESSPAVADGKVYVGSEDFNVYCLNATSGAHLWNYTTGNGVWSSPAFAYGKVYVGSWDNKIYCLDASSGTQLWNYTTGRAVASSPAVADGKLFVGSWNGKVYCLNASTGAHIWSYKSGAGVYSSPAVADGKVYVASLDGKVYAFGGSHEVAVTDVVPSKTVVNQGYSTSMNVTVENRGDFDETFNVTLYANTTSIATQTITLTSGNSTTLTFTWNTSGFVKGNYTISAYAWPVQGETETDTSDNTLIGSWVFVTLPGDINCDMWVNAKDAVLLGKAFQSNRGQPAFNPNADINDDDWVNAKDAIILGKNFNEHW